MRRTLAHPEDPPSTQPRENHKTAPLANQEQVFPDLSVRKKHILSQEALEVRPARSEQIVRDLYRYKVGIISFLDLLTRGNSPWEWVRRLPLPPCLSAKKGGMMQSDDQGSVFRAFRGRRGERERGFEGSNRCRMVQAFTRLVVVYASIPGLSLLGEAEAAREWIDDPARNGASKPLTVTFFRRWLKRENEPADFLTLCGLLERQGQLRQIGDSSYLTSLIHGVPPSGALLYAAGRIAALVYEEIEDAQEQAEHLLFTLQRCRTQDFVPLEAVLEECVADLEALQRREQHLLSVPSARVRGARERCRRGALHFSPRSAPGDGRPREEKYCRHHHCQAAQ